MELTELGFGIVPLFHATQDSGQCGLFWKRPWKLGFLKMWWIPPFCFLLAFCEN